MGSDPDSTTTIKSDVTLFSILNSLHELGESGITDISNHSNIAKATAYKHLKTLEQANWVIHQDEEYRLSLKFFRYGAKRVADIELCEHGKQKAIELAEKTNRSSGFMLREGHQAIETASITTQSYRVMPDRFAYPLHATASGKAILSTLPNEEIKKFVTDHGLSQFTEKTVTDEEELLMEVEEIRDLGYAHSREETSKRWTGIAAPVEHPEKSQVGAIFLGWHHRTVPDSDIEEYLTQLMNAADEIYLRLEY